MEFHPLANEFPLIEGPAFDELCDSIKTYGQKDPILLTKDGKILDGRNRYRACVAIGREPTFSYVKTEEQAQMIALVVAANLHRRHLTESQRAVIAMRLVKLGNGELTMSEAAERMHVSERTVEKVAHVERHGSEKVVSLMSRGDVTVSRAYEVAKGEVKEADILIDNRRNVGAGRPRGNAAVVKFRKLVNEFETIFEKRSEIAAYWPGDPVLNGKVQQLQKFLTMLTRETREKDDTASAVA